MARTSRGRTSGGTTSDKAAPRAERVDLYKQITDTIIAQLEQGSVPWVQPWGDLPGCASVSMPRNALSRRAYSGINVMLLWAGGTAMGYPTQRWLTFKQSLSLGGCVRKGEKGTPVVYADRFTPEQERERAQREGKEARSIAFLKQYTLFNIAQCEGLPEDLYTPPPAPRQDLIEPRFHALMEASGMTFRFGGTMACYRPADDVIVVPPPQAFFEPINAHRTLAHEMSHATGHKSRLARDLTGRYGGEGYAREELCAEISAAYVCASLGIEPTVRHADYIASWIDVLKNDHRAIVQAAGLASRSADWLLGRLPAEYALTAEDEDAGEPEREAA